MIPFTARQARNRTKAVSALLAATISLTSCIAIPIPWFPRNPHAEEVISFLDDENTSRVEVFRELGQPWANLDSRSLVYLADKRSAYILWGAYGGSGGEIPINRDYFLVIDFDDSGMVKHYETYSDSLRHHHCFNNGICLKSRSFNIPLAPPELDQEARRLVADNSNCLVFLFRDEEGEGLAENGYLDILFHRGERYRAFRRIATSVEHGFSRLEFKPGSPLELELSMHPPDPDNQHGPFDNTPQGEIKKPIRRHVDCKAGQMKFFRIYVPEKNNRSIHFHTVDAQTFRQKITGADLLLERRLFLQQEIETGVLVN